MSTNQTEKDAGSNMTAIAEYTPTAAALAELRQKHQGVVYDVTQPKQMKLAKEARAEVKGYRVALETAMDKQPIFIAERFGNAFRGEVLDGSTYLTILITAHTYANETIARIAATRTWAERELAQQQREAQQDQAVECAA